MQFGVLGYLESMVLPEFTALVYVALDLHPQVDLTGTREEIADLLAIPPFGQHAAVRVRSSTPRRSTALQQQLY